MAKPSELSRKAIFVRGVLTDLTIMTCIGLFLGVLGPFGTINQPLGVRLISWLAFAYVGYACYRPVARLVDWGERELQLPRLGLWSAGVLAASVPLTFAVLALGNLHDPFRWPGLDIALTSYFYVLIVGGAVTFIFNLLGFSQKVAQASSMPTRQGASEASEPIAPEPSASDGKVVAKANPLLDALPPALGSDIIALEMEDHYVRVHTALGSELVLMRLRDAMVHVAAIDGRQVHRSWWVARLAVEDVRREGRNVRLVLPGGLEAPVARAQVSELKQAGWI